MYIKLALVFASLAGLDYEAVNETVILTASGDGRLRHCVRINIISDLVPEPEVENFSVVLSSPLLSPSMSPPTLTVWISENSTGKFGG